MKTEEDEAFDDLAKRQGAWGGGFPAKRKMAADKLHWSDCAVHNGPAYPAGKCDCGVAQEPINLLEARKIAAEYGTPDSQIDSGNLYFALSKCLEHIDAQPAQEPVAHLWECLGRWSAYLVENGKQADCAPPSWLVDAINKATTPPLPAQEPVAWTLLLTGEHHGIIGEAGEKFIGAPECYQRVNVYTTPPKREWVGLTEEDTKGFTSHEMTVVKYVSKVLQEKNT